MTFINKKNHLGVPLRVGLSALVPPKYGGTPLLSLTHRSTKRVAFVCTDLLRWSHISLIKQL